MTGLRQRPTAETFPLDDLVDYARKGRLRVPAFQRGLRWTSRDVVLLFDSILNGYPVGSLLLWERWAPADAVTLGPLRVEVPAGDALFVVDGQQRVTALACALTEPGHDDPRYAVGYDLSASGFAPRPARGSDTWLPAHLLYDLSSLMLWFRDRPDLADHFEEATGVSKTLRDVRIPAYVVRQDDESVLRAIFDRLNNAGKRLTRGEVFAALHRADGTPHAMTLRNVAEAVEERTGFGALEDSLVMKLVLARRGPDVLREIRNEFAPDARGRDLFAAQEDRNDAFVRTADATVLAIGFLQRVARVPHLALLPYQHLLVTLTRFFAHHPDPSPRHAQLLRRFFWRAAVAGASLRRGDLTGVGRLLNSAVAPEDEMTSVLGLLNATGGPRSSYPPVDPFLTNSAATKSLLCALWDSGSRSLATGEPVEDGELRAALGDEHTPAPVVVTLVQGRAAAGEARVAGNRLLMPAEADRESDLSEVLATASPEALDSHLLAADDLPLLRTDARVVFVRRAERMRDVQTAFLDRMCEWEHEDSPDLGALVATVDATDAPA